MIAISTLLEAPCLGASFGLVVWAGEAALRVTGFGVELTSTRPAPSDDGTGGITTADADDERFLAADLFTAFFALFLTALFFALFLTTDFLAALFFTVRFLVAVFLTALFFNVRFLATVLLAAVFLTADFFLTATITPSVG